jgi:hypothetical protein
MFARPKSGSVLADLQIGSAKGGGRLGISPPGAPDTDFAPGVFDFDVRHLKILLDAEIMIGYSISCITKIESQSILTSRLDALAGVAPLKPLENKGVTRFHQIIAQL